MDVKYPAGRPRYAIPVPRTGIFPRFSGDIDNYTHSSSNICTAGKPSELYILPVPTLLALERYISIIYNSAEKGLTSALQKIIIGV